MSFDALLPRLALPVAIVLLAGCAPKEEDDTGGGADTGSDTGDTGDTGTDTDTDTGGDTGDTDTGGDTGGDTGTPAGEARVRVTHLSPDAPPVDVYVAGTTTAVVTGLAYGDVTDWLVVPEGTYAFDLRAAGADPMSAPVYTTDAWALADGTTATVAAMGLLTSADPADSFRVSPFIEAWGADTAGSVRVRAIHASPDAPTVDLDVGADGTVDVPGFARFGDTGAEGVVLPAGVPLPLAIWAGGERVTSFTVPALPEGSEVLVFATGLLGSAARLPEGFALLAATEAGSAGFVRQDPVVYVLHGSPDAPPVDAFVGDAELIGDLGFGALAGPLQVPPGSYTFDLYGATAGSMRPDGAPAASLTTPELAAGERYLAIATGFLGDGSFGLLAVAEGWDLSDPSLARLGVIHASPDAPAVDVGTVADGVLTPVVGGLGFGQATDAAGLGLPGGTYALGIAAAGSPDPLLTFDATLTGGQNAWAVAIGSLTGTGEAFRVLAVDTTTTPWSTAVLWQ